MITDLQDAVEYGFSLSNEKGRGKVDDVVKTVHPAQLWTDIETQLNETFLSLTS